MERCEVYKPTLKHCTQSICHNDRIVATSIEHMIEHPTSSKNWKYIVQHYWSFPRRTFENIISAIYINTQFIPSHNSPSTKQLHTVNSIHVCSINVYTHTHFLKFFRRQQHIKHKNVSDLLWKTFHDNYCFLHFLSAAHFSCVNIIYHALAA